MTDHEKAALEVATRRKDLAHSASMSIHALIEYGWIAGRAYEPPASKVDTKAAPSFAADPIEVIDATLKAACIRASATCYDLVRSGPGDEVFIIDFAQKLYKEAKSRTWE